MKTISTDLEHSIELLRRDQLTEEDLRRLVENRDHLVQSLLYAQTSDNSPYSHIDGMQLLRHGEHQELPENPEEWPYGTIIDAIRDGWRIIQFPRFEADDSRSLGLGCEFILEKMEAPHAHA